MQHLNLFLLLIFAFFCTNSLAQQPDQEKLTNFPLRFIDEIGQKATRLQAKLNAQTEKVLQRMYNSELRLRKKLGKIDSIKAQQVFGNIDTLYSRANRQIKKRRGPTEYNAALDTLSAAIKFLDQNPQLLAGNIKNKEQLTKALTEMNGLEARFRKAEDIKNFLKERRQYLKQRLQGTVLAGQLKKMNKEVYYYSQAINEYKGLLQDRKKIERKALGLLSKTSIFKKFMQRNSQLASLLNLPADNNATAAVSFTGLQTRASVQQLISSTIPNAALNPQSFLTQQLGTANQQASGQRNQLRVPEWEDKLGEMPDFKPNLQKTKSFLNRLEYGCDIQFGKVNRFLPASTELAVNVGYKLNDNGTAGIGTSYKLGLGTGVRDIRFSNQGFGLRSFIDWKLKGSIHLSGGYEKNYLPQLNYAIDASGITTPFTASFWQQSGLIGLSKKYSISNKRKGTVQVLFDFLSFKNVPRSQPLIFRTGIKL